MSSLLFTKNRFQQTKNDPKEETEEEEVDAGAGEENWVTNHKWGASR